MSQQVIASIRFQLPSDPMEMADTLAKVGAAWQQFSATVREAGVKVHEQTFSMMERNSKRSYQRRSKVEPHDG
jgi:hypothetical protein